MTPRLTFFVMGIQIQPGLPSSLGRFLLVLLCLAGFIGVATAQSPVQTAAERVEAVADNAKKSVQNAGNEVANKVDDLWRRIDERRLKYRTRDEIIAWVTIGLLIANVFGLVSLGRPTLMQRLGNVALGLTGAFLGGIVAHIGQLDFGLGPMLIRYEDLLLSLTGGLLLILVARKCISHRQKKALVRAAQTNAQA